MKKIIKNWIICFFIVAFLAGFMLEVSHAALDSMCSCCHSCCNESANKMCPCTNTLRNPAVSLNQQIIFNLTFAGYLTMVSPTRYSFNSSRDIFHPPNFS